MIEAGKKVVLFPVEIVVRELDFRLLLAALCVRPDTQIVVGRQHLLQRLLFRLHGGVFVGKNLATQKSAAEYRNYKARNFRTVFLHEEGGLYEGGVKDWARAVHEVLDVGKIEPEDYVCTWGEFQADCYRALQPRCAPRIMVTGHPRFDLCRPRYRPLYEQEAAGLKRRYGQFILVNTNFSWSNAKGMDFFFRYYGVKPGDLERRGFYLDQFCTSACKWTRFIQLINHLSDHFPEFQIVLRPHPGESIHYYTALLQHIPRVTVTRAGTVQAWLLACDALIHDGCTTAIEACQAGTPVINFRPVVDQRFDIVLPNLVGVECATEAAVEQALRDLLAGRSREAVVIPENARRIKAMIANVGAEEDAFERLARIIGQALDEVGPTRVTGFTPVLARQRLKDVLWCWIQPLDPVAWQRRLGKRDRGYQKFPPLKRREIEEKVRRIRAITGRPVYVRFHSSQLLSVFSEA